MFNAVRLPDGKEREKGKLSRQVLSDEFGVCAGVGDLGAGGFGDFDFCGLKVGLFAVVKVDGDADAGVGSPDDDAGVVAVAQVLGPGAVVGDQAGGFDLDAQVGKVQFIPRGFDGPFDLIVGLGVIDVFGVVKAGDDDEHFALAFFGKGARPEAPLLELLSGSGKVSPCDDGSEKQDKQNGKDEGRVEGVGVLFAPLVQQGGQGVEVDAAFDVGVVAYDAHLGVVHVDPLV